MAWHSVRFEYLSESDCFIACLGYAISVFETSKGYLRYMYLFFSDHDALSPVFSVAVLPDCQDDKMGMADPRKCLKGTEYL